MSGFLELLILAEKSLDNGLVCGEEFGLQRLLCTRSIDWIFLEERLEEQSACRCQSVCALLYIL